MLFCKKNVKTNILITILLTIVVPTLLSYLLSSSFELRFKHIPIHSAIETAGGIIAIIISMIFYIKNHNKLLINHFNYASFALFTMGIIDIFHASVMPGNMFIWLHSCAVFFGGVLFMSVWLKEFRVSQKVYSVSALVFVLFPLLFSLASLYYSSYIVNMLDENGAFSPTANALNLIGAIGFFIASVRFVFNYIATQNIDEILFAGHTMLFGIAGMLFVSSVVWDMQWWLWHVLRLMAYIIAFYFLYIEYSTEIKEVQQTYKALENANKKRQAYLKIVDTHVITSSIDTKGIILNASTAFCQISGYTKEELIGQNHRMLKHPETPKELYEILWQTIRSGETWQGELLNQRKDGTKYWSDTIITPRFDEDGNIYRYTAIRTDITDKKTVEILSITDVLTNLYNKRHFINTIDAEIQRAYRRDEYLSFAIMDIDHFKLYNDTYGHQSGDLVLQKIGQILNKHTRRSSDFAFRLGGEEFGLLFIGVDPRNSLKFVEEILKSIEALKIQHINNSSSLYVTASAGLIVQKGQEIQESEALYMLADKQLYKAKESGRNRVLSDETLTQKET